jgi:hypothetical protein
MVKKPDHDVDPRDRGYYFYNICAQKLPFLFKEYTGFLKFNHNTGLQEIAYFPIPKLAISV